MKYNSIKGLILFPQVDIKERVKTSTLHVIGLQIRKIANPTPSIVTTTQTPPLQINHQCIHFWPSCDPAEQPPRYPLITPSNKKMPLFPYATGRYNDAAIPSSRQAIQRCCYPLILTSNTTIPLSPHPAKGSLQCQLSRYPFERSPQSHDLKKPSPYPAEQHI